MTDGLPAYRDTVHGAPRPPALAPGATHDDSARLYADPAEMDDYLATLDAAGMLRCAHTTPRHLACDVCAADDRG